MMKCKSTELILKINDIITPTSCAKMIIELIKYIIYQKELLPYSYERLKLYVSMQNNYLKSDSNDRSEIKIFPKYSFELNKYLKTTRDAYNSLENIFNHIKNELVNNSCHKVDEIVMLLGSSVLTPDNIFRIQIPPLNLVHLSKYHSLRKNFDCLFRSVFASDTFHSLVSNNKCRSNLYILFKMKYKVAAQSTLFIPRYNYKLPTRGQHAVISFDALSENDGCLCYTDFTVYEENRRSNNKNHCSEDNSLSSSASSSSINITNDVLSENSVNLSFTDSNLSDSSTEQQSLWYQVKDSLKSFSDVKSEEKSLLDAYLHSQKAV